MTLDEAAAALHLSRRRVRDLIVAGRIQGAHLKAAPRGPVWVIPAKNGRPVVSRPNRRRR